MNEPPQSPAAPQFMPQLPIEIAPIDGSNHNLADRAANQASTAEKRYLEDDYPDAQGEMMPGQDRPGPREISNAVFAQSPEPVLNPRMNNNLLWQFGQFLDHDFGISVEGAAMDQDREVMSIPVPEDDQFFAPGSSINIERMAVDPTTGTAPGNPRLVVNLQTGWIDASQVYGYGQEVPTVEGNQARTPDALREFAGGRMLVGPGDMLPRVASPLPAPFPSDVFLCGDFFPRCNETPGLTVMHTLFVREHNRKVAEYEAEDPSLSDEDLFQLGRRWVISLMQSITVNEFIPTLTGRNVRRYAGHDPEVNGRLAMEFAGAAYRLGHTLLPRQLEQGDGRPPMDLGETLFQAPALFQGPDDIDAFLRGFVGQRHEKLDCQVVDGVRNFLVVDQPGPVGTFFDLPAINVQRGRELGLPGYNDAREGFGLPRVTSFSDAFDADAASRLRSVYATPDDVDLFPGVVCEQAQGRAHTGPLATTIIHRQIEDLRNADRFWYENILTPAEVREVERYTLHDVIVNNTGMTSQEVHPQALRVTIGRR